LYNAAVIHSFFATDLHGYIDRYESLFGTIERETPGAVFLGGDLLPHGVLPASGASKDHREFDDFLLDFVAHRLSGLKKRLGKAYPAIFVILGNDDGRHDESTVLAMEADGLWIYAHNRRFELSGYTIYGYAYVPPTPFQVKDWERYDVSRYVPPGAVSPEQGYRTVAVEKHEIRHATIERDLRNLAGKHDMDKAVFLFHTPPADTSLDRAALDGKKIDHVPLDLHVGSVAVRRFIEQRRPHLTLHGHIHESTRLTGNWMDRIGSTVMYNGANDGPELSLIKFDLEKPEDAKRVFL
jgi:Icc-related predicted phosphoesterase